MSLEKKTDNFKIKKLSVLSLDSHQLLFTQDSRLITHDPFFKTLLINNVYARWNLYHDYCENPAHQC